MVVHTETYIYMRLILFITKSYLYGSAEKVFQATESFLQSDLS